MASPESADPGTEWAAVYDKSTGLKHIVPAEWLDNPVLSSNFRKTPLSQQQQRDADALVAAANTDDTPPAGDKE